MNTVWTPEEGWHDGPPAAVNLDTQGRLRSLGLGDRVTVLDEKWAEHMHLDAKIRVVGGRTGEVIAVAASVIGVRLDRSGNEVWLPINVLRKD